MNELRYTTSDDRYELKKAHDDDAGYDLIAAHDVEIVSGGQRIIDTPFCISIPIGYVGVIKDRSSMAGSRLYTHAGIIDAGYTGNVKVLLENISMASIKIVEGMKIAQLVIVPIFSGKVVKVMSLSDTERGDNGFGSTGK